MDKFMSANNVTSRGEDAAVFSTDTIMAARKRQGDRCAACGSNLSTVDNIAHAFEQMVNPRDELDNCVVVCLTCDHSLAPGSTTGKTQYAARTRTMYGFWEASAPARR